MKDIKNLAGENPFVQTKVEYSAEVCWWWTDEKLHDQDYHIKVNDAVNAAVHSAVAKYDVIQDTRYCCQWEGVCLCGDEPEPVAKAARDVAQALARFKGVRPL